MALFIVGPNPPDVHTRLVIMHQDLIESKHNEVKNPLIITVNYTRKSHFDEDFN